MPVNLENPAVAIGLFSFQSQCQRMFKPPHSCTHLISVQLSSVAQPCLTLCDPWTAARQASLSITNSRSLHKLMSIELVMPSNHLILCSPLLLILPSIFPSIRVFGSVLHIKVLELQPQHQSFQLQHQLQWGRGCHERLQMVTGL